MIFMSNDPVRDAEDYYNYCEAHRVEEEKPKCPICGEEVGHFGDNCRVCASVIDAALSMALDNIQHMLQVDRKKAEDILCDRVSEL